MAIPTKWCWLTVKDGMVMASAGIDESNADGKLILLPRDSYLAADELRSKLKAHFHLRELGVLLTDSRTLPLRAGVIGVSVGHAGFRAVRNYIGKPDIFGRNMTMSRTDIVDSLAAAAVLVMGEGNEHLGSLAQRPDEFLIRPPGAQNEAELLSRCIRCGQCMKVCITNGIQPVLWEAGLEGLYTPRLIPRMGYCAHSCNLCGQVCPTGAIPKLELAVKQATPLGTAFINRSRCIPYTEGADCLVCEEHCPVSPKAITFVEQEVVNHQGERVKVKLPVVLPDRCIGCGHCEKVCPVGGAAAVRVKKSLRMEM